MTDEFSNWKSGVLDEDYFSDEELREAFINPDKHIVLKKDTNSFDIIQKSDEVDYAEIDKEDLTSNAILKLYESFLSYTRENSLLILDKMTISDLEYFVNNED